VKRPMRVAIGSADEIFIPDRMVSEFAALRRDISVEIVAGPDHGQMMEAPAALAAVTAATAALTALRRPVSAT
jgi:hypothetical protein